MSAPSPCPRASSVRANLPRFLPLLLGILVTLVLGTLVFELSLINLDTSGANPDEIPIMQHVADVAGVDLEALRDVQHVLDAAAAAGDAGTTPHGFVSTFYLDEMFETDWSTKIKESDILHAAALYRGCLQHKNSVISWKFGRTEQNEVQNLLHVVNKTDPRLLEKLKQCPDVDVFIPEGVRNHGYCEDAAAYTKCTSS